MYSSVPIKRPKKFQLNFVGLFKYVWRVNLQEKIVFWKTFFLPNYVCTFCLFTVYICWTKIVKNNLFPLISPFNPLLIKIPVFWVWRVLDTPHWFLLFSQGFTHSSRIFRFFITFFSFIFNSNYGSLATVSYFL